MIGIGAKGLNGGCRFMHGLNLVRIKAQGFVLEVALVSQGPAFERSFAMPHRTTTCPVWAGPGQLIC